MVAVTDYWPQEEGYIVEGSPVMMCVSTSAITENACVRLTATTVGQVSVGIGVAAGDCIGVALRSCDSGQVVPVAFRGIVKMLADATIVIGTHVQSSTNNLAAVVDTPGAVNIIQGTDVAGTVHVFGTALQGGINDQEDEILILIGRH